MDWKKRLHGIDRKALEASINSREFSYREADYGSTPRGLCCGLDMLQSWLYDDSAAFTYMHGGEIYKELRSRLGTDYFEDLLKSGFEFTAFGASFLRACSGIDR